MKSPFCYDKLGFPRVEDASDGAVIYRLELASYVASTFEDTPQRYRRA